MISYNDTCPLRFKKCKGQDLTNEVLSIYEIAMIYHYSDSGYEYLNENLIKNKGMITTDYEQFLAETLQKLPSYQNAVFRGTTLNKPQKQRYIEALSTNKVIQEYYFLSTSISEIVANLFSKGDTLFTIFSKTGKQIEKFSKFGLYSGQNEKEVLFLPNATFEVLAVSQVNSKTLIILEEIL